MHWKFQFETFIEGGQQTHFLQSYFWGELSRVVPTAELQGNKGFLHQVWNPQNITLKQIWSKLKHCRDRKRKARRKNLRHFKSAFRGWNTVTCEEKPGFRDRDAAAGEIQWGSDEEQREIWGEPFQISGNIWILYCSPTSRWFMSVLNLWSADVQHSLLRSVLINMI